MDLIGLLGAAIALFALIFAVKQYRDAREHTAKLGELANKAIDQQARLEKILISAAAGAQQLQTLADSLPTRFVGKFPHHLDTLARFVGEAKQEMHVLCDYVGYGSYSNPISFTSYFEEIRQRCVGQHGQPAIKFKILVYSRAAGDAVLPLQFDEDAWEAMKSSEEFTTFYEIFKERFPSVPSTFDAWNDQWWDIEEGYRQGLRYCSAEIGIVSKPAPVFVWLRDNKDMLFSIQGTEGFNDFMFRTSDLGFIEFFRKQFDAALTNSVAYKPVLPTDQPLLCTASRNRI
jgi:hypothetical protein